MAFPRFLTRCFWIGQIDRLRNRIGRPRGLGLRNESRLSVDYSSGVDGVSVDLVRVWSEGKEKCEHHWHKVTGSGQHMRTSMKDGAHEDFVCCKCTYGLCETKRRTTNAR